MNTRLPLWFHVIGHLIGQQRSLLNPIQPSRWTSVVSFQPNAFPFCLSIIVIIMGLESVSAYKDIIGDLSMKLWIAASQFYLSLFSVTDVRPCLTRSGGLRGSTNPLKSCDFEKLCRYLCDVLWVTLCCCYTQLLLICDRCY